MIGLDLFAPLEDPVARAFLFTWLAGLSTGVGALVVIFLPNSRALLAQAMAFAAGAMIAVSFVELLATAIDGVGLPIATGAFLLGAILTFGLDLLSPWLLSLTGVLRNGDKAAARKAQSLRIESSTTESAGERTHADSASRVALVATLAVALHNLPEGFAVFLGAYDSLQLGIVLMVAIAVHNIPEGMAIAAPVLRATGSRVRAFWAALASGLLEPVGAVVGGLLLTAFITPALVDFMLAFVAGVMVYVSLDELLPAAREQARSHAVALSLLIGMGLMLLTLMTLSP